MSAIGNPNFVNPTKVEKVPSPLLSFTGADAVTTWTHNEGRVPDFVEAEFVCITTNGGYPAGTVIPVKNGPVTNGIGDRGQVLYYDENSASLAVGVAAILLNTSFNTFGLAAGNWRLRFTLYYFTIGDQPDITRVGYVPLKRKVVKSGDTDLQFNLEQYFNEYEDFEIDYKDLQNDTNNTDLQTRFSADGSTFLSGASDYNDSYLAVRGGLVADGAGTTSYAYGSVFTTGTALGQTARGTIKIDAAENPNERTALRGFCYGRNPNPADWVVMFGSNRNNEEVTKAIQFFASSGNLGSGTFILYGKRKVA